MPDYSWHAIDLKTGKRGPQLQMQTRGTVSRIIGEATDAQGAVLCWDQQGVTEVGRTVLAVNRIANPQPNAASAYWFASPGPSDCTATYTTDADGRPAVRFTRVSANAIALYGGRSPYPSAPVPVAQGGEVITVVTKARSNVARAIFFQLGYGASSAIVGGSFITWTPVPGQTDVLRGSITVPMTGPHLGERLHLKIFSAAGGAAGDWVDFSDVLWVTSDQPYTGPYFDGHTVRDGEYYVWDGSTNGSTSTRYLPQLVQGAATDWEAWTEPGRMMALLVDPEDRPVWGGIILRRVPDETVWVPLTMVTLEHYLDRRYSGGMATSGEIDQAAIASALVNATLSNDGVPFIIDAKLTGVLRERTYFDSEDKTTLSLLTDLMNLQNGLEFTVDLEWSDAAHTVLKYMFRIRSRIGTSLAQPTRFEYPGPVQKFSIPQDYTKEHGANDVMAVSSGEGDARPESSHWVDTAALSGGWARYERRWTPSTSISEIATLDSYAEADLAEKRDGLTELSLVANLDTCPRLNADWWLGDDITAAITAPAFPATRDSNGTVQPGYERRVRVVGWTIDLDARTLTPNLREY